MLFFGLRSFFELECDFFANFKKIPMNHIYRPTKETMADLGVASYMGHLGIGQKVAKKLTLQQEPSGHLRKSKNFPGSRKVKYGSGGPYWVSQSVSAHFLRSGPGLEGSIWGTKWLVWQG